MDEEFETEAAAIAEIARKPQVVINENGKFLLAVPHGYDLLDRSDHLPHPARAEGSVHMHDADSFIALVNRQADESRALIYVNADYADCVKAVAVLNDHHTDGTAGWRDHCIHFSPRRTNEWDRWLNANGRAAIMTQSDFAFFLEANADDIIEPAGGDILRFVTTLSETRKVRYGSAINLQNGMMQIEFTEEGDNATRGKLDLFKEFTLALRPLRGAEPYKLKARLRYRIDRNSGEIAFWIDLHRPERILEDATAKVVERLQAETAVQTLFGTP